MDQIVGNTVPAKIHMASSLIGTPKPAANRDRKYAIGGVVDKAFVIDPRASAGDEADMADCEKSEIVCEMEPKMDRDCAVVSIDAYSVVDDCFLEDDTFPLELFRILLVKGIFDGILLTLL